MAQKPRWTYEQVAAEAAAILAEGAKPTARLIQQRLGAATNTKPSMSAIHKYFREWEDGQARPRAAVVDIPDAVRNALTDFIEAEVRSRTTELETKVASAQTAADDLAAENDRIDTELAATKLVLADAESAKAKAETLATERKAALDKAAEEAEKARLAAEEAIKRERVGAETARQELALAMLRLKNLPQIEAKADRVEVLASEKSDLTARVELIARRLADTEAKLDEVAGDRDRIRADLAAAEAAGKVLAAQKADSERELAICNQERERERRAAEQEREREVAALKERIADLAAERNSFRAAAMAGNAKEDK